jgi:hypothetical protein
MNINGANSNISVQEYWKRVRAIQRDLPDAVHLVSTPDPRINERDRGLVQFVEAESLIAAQCIFAGTHRVATQEEIVAQEKKRDIDIRERARLHLASQGIVAIQLPEQSSSK